jgi:hypothetical protein
MKLRRIFLALFCCTLNTLVFSCDESTPTINLEEEVPYPGARIRGPLYNVRRDHQDGLGTCYANTARNILIGLTNGAINPSYLDLAILFKRSQNASAREGLDLGGTCETISVLQSTRSGICDQSQSPLETGEPSPGAALFLQNDPAEGSQAAAACGDKTLKFSTDENIMRPTSFRNVHNFSRNIKSRLSCIVDIGFRIKS